MFENLFGDHSGNLLKAMDRTAQRQTLLAGNLANANTPGYQRRDVDFAVQLDGASSRFAPQLPARIREMRSRDSASIRQDGSSVDMETEVVRMHETSLRYETLTELTSRHFRGLKNAIREGK